MRVFAVKHKSPAARRSSQSGGLFSAAAEVILARGGVVYGCYGRIEDGRAAVSHIRVDSLQELDKIKGSKYVQSCAYLCYGDLIEDLAEGRQVLFGGTSCQVDGLLRAVRSRGVSDERLYTCDIICHGVPSLLSLNKYIEYTEQKHGGKAVQFNLRDKSFGTEPITSVTLDDGEKISNDIYPEMFYSNVALRPSCGACRYTTYEKPADITMGDLVGIQSICPEFVDDINLGFSVAFVRSEKGLALFEETNTERLEIEKYYQPNLDHPSYIPRCRDKFYHLMLSDGFEKAMKKYTKLGGLPTKLKRRVLKRIGRW